MAMVIRGGSAEFGQFAFGQKSQATLNFLENQVTNLSQTLTDAGRSFMQRGAEIFERYNGAEAIRMTKAALRAAQHAFQADVIRPLRTISEMQQAPLSMQRWIMACPEIRQMYHEQRCDGYSPTYVDLHPKDIGENHRDWQIVMSGLVRQDEEGDTFFTEYLGDENDPQLDLVEQEDILTTWDLIMAQQRAGKEDATDPYCGKL